MQVYFVGGTYELFRHYFVLPSHKTREGIEVATVRGVFAPMLSLLEGGATHAGVATGHVVESFRNDLCPGYKTGAGVAPDPHSFDSQPGWGRPRELIERGAMGLLSILSVLACDGNPPASRVY